MNGHDQIKGKMQDLYVPEFCLELENGRNGHQLKQKKFRKGEKMRNPTQNILFIQNPPKNGRYLSLLKKVLYFFVCFGFIPFKNTKIFYNSQDPVTERELVWTI